MLAKDEIERRDERIRVDYTRRPWAGEALSKKTAKADWNSTKIWQRNTKDRSTEIRPSDKTTVENTTGKPAGTGEA